MNPTALLLLALLNAGAPSPPADPCDGVTTQDMIACIQGCNEEAEGVLRGVVTEVRRVFGDAEGWSAAFDDAVTKWEAFVEADCLAAYTSAGGGSIRGIYAVECRLEHTRSRAKQLWAQYLRGADTQEPMAEPVFECGMDG